MTNFDPLVLAFSDVAEKRGTWISIGQLEQLMNQSTLRDSLSSENAQYMQQFLTDKATQERATIDGHGKVTTLH
jgi:hypothetical protein